MQEVENEDVDSGLKCLDVVEVTDREQNDSEEGKTLQIVKNLIKSLQVALK